MIYLLLLALIAAMTISAFGLGWQFGKARQQDQNEAANKARIERERYENNAFDEQEAQAIRNLQAWQQAALEAFGEAQQITFVQGKQVDYPMPPKPVEPGFGKTQPSTVVGVEVDEDDDEVWGSTPSSD